MICMILKTPIKCCALCPIHFRATSCDIRATSCELFSLFLLVIKIRYIGQCVKNKIHEYRYTCAIHLFLCLFCFCNVYIYIFHVVCACQFIWYVSLAAVCKMRATLAWKRSGSIFELILVSVFSFRKCRQSIFLRCQTYPLTLPVTFIYVWITLYLHVLWTVFVLCLSVLPSLNFNCFSIYQVPIPSPESIPQAQYHCLFQFICSITNPRQIDLRFTFKLQDCLDRQTCTLVLVFCFFFYLQAFEYVLCVLTYMRFAISAFLLAYLLG